MAKTKSTNSPKRKTTSSAKRKIPASDNGQPAAPAKKATTKTQRPLASEEIGQVAGELWGVLSTDGGQSLAAIKKAIDAPPELILAALGWLAREDKLDFSNSGRTLKVSLRQT